jgi:hypothetical protein
MPESGKADMGFLRDFICGREIHRPSFGPADTPFFSGEHCVQGTAVCARRGRTCGPSFDGCWEILQGLRFAATDGAPGLPGEK